VTGVKSNVVSYTITSLTAGSLVAASFADSGLYIYNSLSETWSIVNSINPENVIYPDSTIYVDFGALGLYKWSGGSWAQLTSVKPGNMVASGSMLYVDFGAMAAVGLRSHQPTLKIWWPLVQCSMLTSEHQASINGMALHGANSLGLIP